MLFETLFLQCRFQLIRLIEFQNKRNIEIIGLMHFGFALDLWNIDLRDMYLLDTDLDLWVGHG